MKALNTLKKIIYSTTFVFTVTVFVFMAMFTIIENDTTITQTRAIPLSSYPWILLFSFIVGALDNMLTAKKIPLGLRLPVHFVGVLGAFYVIMLRVFGLGQNGRGRFSVMITVAIIYAVVLGAAYIIRRGIAALISRLEINAQLKQANTKDSDTQKASTDEI